MADRDSAIDMATGQLGYEMVKLEQKEVAKAFVKGNERFVSLPTGYVKSICYTVLPFVFNLHSHSSYTSIGLL